MREKHLDQLVAILCRPQKFFWFIRKYFTGNQDPRAKFMNRTLKKRSRKLGSVDHRVKYSVYPFFKGVFLILDHLPNPDDFLGEVAFIDMMKQIGHQVIVRMLHDKMKCEPLAEKAIPGVDLNTATFDFIGPVSEFISFFSINFKKGKSLPFFSV